MISIERRECDLRMRKSMNKVILMGRLTKDPEVRYSQGEASTAVARFSLAVDRRFKRDNGPTADFINCVAFGKTGEFIEKYCHQGTKLCVEGRIQTGSYTNKDGQTIFTTDVVVEEHEFCEKRGETGNVPEEGTKDKYDGFMNIPYGIEEELPFT